MFFGALPFRLPVARCLTCVAMLPLFIQAGQAQPAGTEKPQGEVQSPDPQTQMEPLPGLGVDWPDMDAPDTITPLDEGPDEAQADGGEEGDEGIVADAETAPPVDYTSELKYRVVLRGLDEVADDQFRDRFNDLSVLREGEGEESNIAQINRRAKEDIELLERILRAKGYYDARVVSEIVPARGDERLQVVLDTAPGERYVLDEVNLPGLERATENRDALYKAFPVKPGDAVDADRIVAARLGLAGALGENGYPFASVEEPVVRIDGESRLGDLTVPVDPAGYRRFGRIQVDKGDIFSARHVQRIARFRPGDPYRTSEVTDLRRALVATGLISSVEMTPKDAGDGQTVDLAVDLEPAPPRTIAGQVGYGSGEGIRAEVSWQHRNFFPPEGAMTFRGVAGTQEQSLAAIFRRSNFRKRDQVLNAQISASNINRDAYDAKTFLISGSLERQTNLIFQRPWTWSVGAELLASEERDTVGPDATPRERVFLIGALPLSVSYDGSDDLLDPSRGFRLGARISPELSLQSGTFGYMRAQLDASVYQPVTDRVVLAARARAGTVIGATRDRIAPSRRFYAGGGGSVRGYAYQHIGPRDANDDPIGGRSLTEFSLEARIRFGNFGVVPFVDAGSISTSQMPDLNDLQFGAGLGVRYYSSFGPIRVDVGTPINRQPGDSRLAVYVSLGQAF
jgi:translocation and assembly module TamA